MEVAPVDGLNIAHEGTNQKYAIVSNEDKSGSEAVDQQQKQRKWGLQKVTLRLLVALTVSVIIVLALAIVAGVLLSKNHSKNQDQRSSALPSIPQSTSSSADSAVGISSTPSSPSPTSTSTSTSTTASASPSTTGSSITPPLGASAPRDCPGSNGKTFIPNLPFDTSSSSSGTWVKHCDSTMAANNKTNLASFVVNSFDLCIQACAGQELVAAIAATYHWKDGTEEPGDGQRPGSCWCQSGSDAKLIQSDNADTAIIES